VCFAIQDWRPAELRASTRRRESNQGAVLIGDREKSRETFKGRGAKGSVECGAQESVSTTSQNRVTVLRRTISNIGT